MIEWVFALSAIVKCIEIGDRAAMGNPRAIPYRRAESGCMQPFCRIFVNILKLNRVTMEIPTHKTIDEVLAELDIIIDNAIRDRDYIGIFAYAYRLTTLHVKANIGKLNFEDNDRMGRLDVIFANLYLDAVKNYTEKKPVSRCWKLAFDAGHQRLALAQHLLLGMNAHINLDLAIAAGRIMKGKDIKDLENDFNSVNAILASLLDTLQLKMDRVSPLMFLLDWLGRRTDEKIINFSMVEARKQSWRIARELWELEGEALEARIDEVDRSVTELAGFIKSPKPGLLRFVMKLISWFEVHDVRKVLERFRDDAEPLLNPDAI